jgi:hypothetical protein
MPVTNLYAGYQFICRLPIYMPVANLYAGYQFICRLPIYMPVTNLYAGCQFICRLPIYMPVTNLYAGCQFICRLPIYMPVANLYAGCQFICRLPIPSISNVQSRSCVLTFILHNFSPSLSRSLQYPHSPSHRCTHTLYHLIHFFQPQLSATTMITSSVLLKVRLYSVLPEGSEYF